ncbi:MAG: class I SAM-dependent methyltransferase [Gemmatimonadaceae bacterium]
MTDSRQRRAARFVSVYWRAAVGSAYALTAGIGHRRHRGLLTDIARHFGYDHTALDARLPRASIDEMVPRGLALDLRELHAVDGNVSVLELVILAATAARLKARTVFEIGTFDGRTAVNLAANADNAVTVYTLDLPLQGSATVLAADAEDLKYMQPSLSGARIRQSEFAPRVRQLFGDSAKFDFRPYVGSIDLCFVDGAHSREYVLNDSRRALELTHPGSIILWHDYAMWPGVTQALNELREGGGACADIRWIEGTTLAVLVRGSANAE